MSPLSSSASDANTRWRNASLVLGVGLLVAVAVIGYLLGTTASPVEPVIPREPMVGVAPDTRAMDTLHAEFRELRDELSRVRPERDVRTPAVPTLDTNERLIAVLERLEAAIGRLEPGQAQSASRPRDAALIGRLDRELALHQPVPAMEEGSGAIWEWMNDRSRELTAQHALWSVDDVIAAYGRPTHVESDNVSITLRYEIRRLDEDRGVELRFNAASLRIVYVTVSYF